jgi:hypothetical protein
MKSIGFRFLFSLLIACHAAALSPSVTSAQTKTPTQRQEEGIANTPKSTDLIEIIVNTAGEAQLWTDKKTAVWFLANAADLVWNDTPDHAQTWIRTAWKLTEELPDAPANEKLKEFFTRSVRVDMRTTILGVARKHDGKLADGLLKELAANEARDKTSKGAFDDRTARSEQLLQMAQQVIDSNPDVAFALAERSLADGISFSLQNVLTGLRLKKVDLANRLFDSALVRFSSMADPSEAQVLAGYLFQSGFTFSTDSSGQTILVINPAHQNLPAVALSEPQRAKAFLVAVYQALLTRPEAIYSPDNSQRTAQTLVLGDRLLAFYDSFEPELAPSTRGLMAHLRRQLYPESETPSSERFPRTDTTNSDTTKRLTREEIYEHHISALEEKADRQNDPISQKLGYVEAAVATNPPDYQRAIGIVEKINSADNLRQDAKAFLLYRASLFFIDRGDIDKAAALEPQVHDFVRQAVLNLAIAQHLTLTTGTSDQVQLDRQRAFDLLTEMRSGLERAKTSAKIAKIALARTAILGRLDRLQGLTALEEALQIINGLDSFDIRDRSAPSLGLDDSISGATVAAPKVNFDLGSAIEPLLQTNFADVSAAAETLRSKEMRGVARLEIARLFLKQNARSNKGLQLTQARPRN